jgi:RloB-like protein
LVRIAIKLRKEQAKEGPPYDQVWCVFDRDDFPVEHFQEAFTVAAENDIEIAYSNQAFELWYLLHFNYYNAAVSRASYIERLSKLLGHKYEKNSRTIYHELKEKQPDAIRNAARLLASYAMPEPEKNDPSTTVHKLVAQLNQYT